VFGVRAKSTSKFSAASAPLREKKQLTLAKAQSTQRCWGKNKIKIEVLGGLGAFAREE
jgi:hypothetical protein